MLKNVLFIVLFGLSACAFGPTDSDIYASRFLYDKNAPPLMTQGAFRYDPDAPALRASAFLTEQQSSH